jgi:uncharacterized protein (DUF1778 family)
MENIFSPLQRIIILQGLEAAAGRELSNEMIQRLLRANAHSCSLAQVNDQIAWLENRGYVRSTRMGDSCFVNVHITRAGIDVASGYARAEGIDPPPEDRMGQKSAVDRLPENLRSKFLEMLQNPAITQAEIVDAINAEAGETLLSRSSMNRYAQRMKRFADKNRQAKEIADAYMEKYGNDNRVKLGKVVNEQIRLAVFDLIGEIEEISEDPEVKKPQIADMLYKLSRGLKELEAAEKLNAERTESICKAALTEAAETVERTAKSNGLTAETVDKIKTQILGL